MGPEEFFLVWKNLCGKIVEIAEKIDAEREKAEKLRQREKKKEEAAKAPPVARGGGVARGGRTGAPSGRAGDHAETETPGESGAVTEGEGGDEAGGRRGGGARRGGPAARRGGGRAGRGGNVEDQDVVNSLFAKMQATNVYKDRRNN